jgi:hypothetical protein
VPRAVPQPEINRDRCHRKQRADRHPVREKSEQWGAKEEADAERRQHQPDADQSITGSGGRSTAIRRPPIQRPKTGHCSSEPVDGVPVQRHPSSPVSLSVA